MATVGILASLVRSEEGALVVAQSAPSAVKLWEQINQLLQRKMEMERKYIERLEGKDSDSTTSVKCLTVLEAVWERLSGAACLACGASM